jgi:Zn-finger nucleic acid-binding protein
MNCPIDGATLQMSDRQGIEIDYCPECRGVWLDRGELDKIIERSATWDGGRGDAGRDDRSRSDDRDRDRRRDDDWDDDRWDDRSHGKKKRKKPSSFLESLMEFGE